MKSFSKYAAASLVVSTATLTCGHALGNSIVAPGAFESTPGNSSNTFPFSTNNPIRFQQVFDAGVIGSAGDIQALAFRLDESVTPNTYSGTFDIEIRLSHTSYDSNSITKTFATNITGTETLVLDDNSYAVQANANTGTGANPFDLVFDFTDTFAYDDSLNLLLDISISSGFLGGSPRLDTVSGSAGNGLTRVLQAGNSSATTGTVFADSSLVTQVIFTPAPATFSSGLLGLSVLILRRRRSKA